MLFSVSNCNLSKKENQRKTGPGPAGSNSGDHQSAVGRSDRSSFYLSFG